MRATAMSMFLSRARATASSSARSTRGPGVLNGALDWPVATGATGGWPAGIAGAAGVCAIAGANAASTRTADSSTFFFTNASNTLELKIGLPTIAAAIARPLAAHLFRLGVDLGALFGRQHLIHAIEHQDAPFPDGGPRGLDLVDLRHNGGLVGRCVEHHLVQFVLELVETLERFRALLVILAPDRFGAARGIIADLQPRPILRVHPPWCGVPLVGLAVLLSAGRVRRRLP